MSSDRHPNITVLETLVELGRKAMSIDWIVNICKAFRHCLQGNIASVAVIATDENETENFFLISKSFIHFDEWAYALAWIV